MVANKTSMCKIPLVESSRNQTHWLKW